MPWSWSSRIKTGNGPCIGQPDGTGLCESSFRRVVIWRMGAPSLDCFFKEYEWGGGGKKSSGREMESKIFFFFLKGRERGGGGEKETGMVALSGDACAC